MDTTNTRLIPEAVLPLVRQRDTWIAQQRHITACLEMELQALLARACNVNLASEEWRLDVAHGLLTRVDPPPEDGTATDDSEGAVEAPSEG